MITESDVIKLREMTYDMDKTVKRVKALEYSVVFEKTRATLLAEDKVKLNEELDLEKTHRRWTPLSQGACPDNIRVLVRGKDKYAEFATLKGGVWLSGRRMLLDFIPLDWMLVPE